MGIRVLFFFLKKITQLKWRKCIRPKQCYYNLFILQILIFIWRPTQIYLCFQISLTWLSILQKRFTIVVFRLFAWIQSMLNVFLFIYFLSLDVGEIFHWANLLTFCIFVFVSIHIRLKRVVTNYLQPIQWFIYHMLWQLADFDGNYIYKYIQANVTHTFTQSREEKVTQNAC